MTKSELIWAALGALALSGCGNFDAAHLVFGQQHTVGLDINMTAPEQGGALSLGYKDKNIAIIPVAVKNADIAPEQENASTENEVEQGDLYQLLGGTNKLKDGGDVNDAYSTLGQFEMDTGQNGTLSAGLGKFFATGVAAQTLAEGFKGKLSNQQEAAED